jgi:hypothetical protein
MWKTRNSMGNRRYKMRRRGGTYTTGGDGGGGGAGRLSSCESRAGEDEHKIGELHFELLYSGDSI